MHKHQEMKMQIWSERSKTQHVALPSMNGSEQCVAHQPQGSEGRPLADIEDRPRARADASGTRGELEAAASSA